VRLLLSCGDVLQWRKGEHERGELTDLTGHPFNRLALQTLLRRVLRGLITFGSFHESRDSMLTRRKFLATTVCTVSGRRQPMIRGVRYVFGLSPHASQLAAAGRELRRVLFDENLPHFATLAIRAALGLVKGFQRSFFRAQRAKSALCFEFLACRRRRFRALWLPPPLAETSEGFLYLRTKAGRAARI
jgi:hypothetical protein